jgi:hypothetical protein
MTHNDEPHPAFFFEDALSFEDASGSVRDVGHCPLSRSILLHLVISILMQFDPSQASAVQYGNGLIKLTPGQRMTVTIEAKLFNNRTKVWFESGAVYDFKATGMWFDAGHPAGPDGYSDGTFLQNLAWWARRSPDHNWFALLGVAGPGQAPFLIGTHATCLARQSGELLCFANDVAGFYWNNTGAVTLTITRIR